ncbi:hypothetical protein AB7M70_011834 [Bradyrhizobium japonicum]
MAKSPYQLWLEDKKRKEQEAKKNAEQGTVNFKEASKASRVQYTIPYEGKSKEKTYKWETDLLKPLSVKQYGKSYEDKYKNWAKSQGMSDVDAAEYRRMMDFQEDRKNPNSYAYGSRTQGELLDDIFSNLEKRTQKQNKLNLDKFLNDFNSKWDAENQQKQQELAQRTALEKKSNKNKQANKKDEPFLTDVKNFFTGKDTDGDGQRNGLLGFVDRYLLPISQAADEVLLPGNEANQRRNEIEKYGKIVNPATKAGMEDRGTETKVLHGIGTTLGYVAPMNEAYNVVNAGVNKIPKLANYMLQHPVVGRAIRGGVATGLGETALAVENELVNPDAGNIKDYAKRIGIGTAAGAVGDPLFYGAGKAIGKGFESASNRSMRSLLPSNEQVQQALSNTVKSVQAEQALPVPGGVRNTGLLQDLIPKANDISNPDYVPSLLPRIIPKVEAPKVNTRPLDEMLANPRTDVVEPQPFQTIQLPKNAAELTPDELRSVYQQLVDKKQRLVTGSKGDSEVVYQRQLDAVNNDIQKAKDLISSKKGTTNPDPVVDDLTNVEQLINQPRTVAEIDNELKTLETSDKKLQTNRSRGRISNEEYYQKLQENEVQREALVKEKETASAVENQQLVNIPTPKPQQTESLLPDVNRTAQEPEQSLIPNINRNTPKQVSSPLEQPPRASEQPSDNLKERGHIETLRESENASQSLKERIKGLYEPTTNEKAVEIANQEIAKGLDNAVNFVKSTKDLRPEHVATAHRLIQEFQNAGEIEKAVDIAEYIAEKGTEVGQTVQAFSIFNRLSPEGILVHANRIVNKANAKLNVLQEKVVLNNETAAQLTDLASTVEKMTQQKTVANDVINLMEKAKRGEKLSAEETKLIRQFVDDAKQWIGDITPKKTKPKAPKKIISPAVKEHVVSFLDSQEEAARRRLAARKNRANSLPAEDFYDYAVIGASKLAKGTIKFADFSEQMIKEFGEEIRPYIQQIYDKASEMVNNEVQRTVNRLSEVQKITNKAIKNGKLDEIEAENLRKFALAINSMSGDAKIEASQELQAVLQGLERPSFLQQVSTTQTIAQLLNPKTLGRNAIGNELFYRLERINKLVATPIDWSRVAIFGGKRSVTFRTNNQGEYWKNWMRGWKAGWKGVNPEGLSTQYDLYPKSFNAKWNPMRYLERTLGAALKSFDYAGYKRGVNDTIGELATLRATNEGLTGQAKKEAIQRYIREADENILAIADQYGKYVTFQDNNIIAVGLQRFKRGLNVGKEFGMGDLIIKYPKTPGALLARALEYSPAGFLKSAYAIAKPFFKKEFSTSEVIESFTRALIGSAGTMGIAWFLADKGIITGGGSKDFDVKELEKSVGKAEYSLNIDALTRWVLSGFNGNAAETQQGDKFISYNWAQPVAMSVAIAANANNNAKSNGKPSFGGAAWEATNGALDSLVGMSVLQGVQRSFTSYPGQSVGDKLTDIAGQLPASFVPTISNQIRQKADNTARNVYDPLKLNQYNNQAKNKIPVLASTLPAGYDTLGNKKEVYQNKSNTFFNVFLNPAFVSRYNPSPEAEMVLQVINDTGDTSVAPRRAQKYLMIDGKRYDLTPEQYSDYQRRLGEEVRMQLQSLGYGSNSEELGEKISKILDAAGRKLRNELKEEYGG